MHAMKRRNFLSMIGAATLAPALPFAAPVAAPTTPMSASMSSLAARLIQSNPHVHAVGLSRGTGLPLSQAQQLLAHLRATGLSQGQGVKTLRTTTAPKARQDTPALPLWIAHLRAMCVAYGHPIGGALA